MNFKDFKILFIRSLEIAVANAEEELGKPISRTYEVMLYGAGHSGDILDVDTAVKEIYLDERKFYRVIDVAVQRVSPKGTRLFMRVSGHKPVPFEQTWNTPEGSGPFKQIMAQIAQFDE